MTTQSTQFSFTLSAFGDEIVADLEGQLEVLADLKIGYLDLRGAWGVNVLRMDDEMAGRVRQLCDQAGIGVACIGSPIGKSPIADPPEKEQANLARIFRVAERVGARRVRIFSFYPPAGASHQEFDGYVERAAHRLARLAEMAGQEGFILVLENEKGIVGDTIARCHRLLGLVNSPHFRFAWDPANFVQEREADVTVRGWPLLGPYVAHVHIKDASLADGKICPAGAGDGQVVELLAALRDSGYQGFLSLEPHLLIARHSSGFSGPEGMATAARALRKLMAEVGCGEAQ
jgi:sugar phosphate isomerase/epimerase